MRHGKYGLTTATSMTNDEIKKNLSAEALKELETEVKSKPPPVTFIIQEIVNNRLDPGAEFTIIDLFLLIHTDEEHKPAKAIKMQTLRTTLSNISRKPESNIEVSKKASKIRLYKKKFETEEAPKDAKK
jgi:hypothetical protein